MEINKIIPHIEALIFASEKPLTSSEIVELINNAFAFMEERITPEQVESCIEGISEKYQSEFYPFEVKESGGGWQFLTKKDFHKTIAQLNGDKFLKRLSTAAMETLAIIAYKNPITKGEIESIRGVNSDYSIQKLLEKELIVITGRSEHLPGKPLVYSTSKSFMDYFGINSAEDLPKIKEVLADQLVQPTVVTDEDFKSEATSTENNEIPTHVEHEEVTEEDNINTEDKSTEIDASVDETIEEEIVSNQDESSEENNLSVNEDVNAINDDNEADDNSNDEEKTS